VAINQLEEFKTAVAFFMLVCFLCLAVRNLGYLPGSHKAAINWQ